MYDKVASKCGIVCYSYLLSASVEFRVSCGFHTCRIMCYTYGPCNLWCRARGVISASIESFREPYICVCIYIYIYAHVYICDVSEFCLFYFNACLVIDY